MKTGSNHGTDATIKFQLLRRIAPSRYVEMLRCNLREVFHHAEVPCVLPRGLPAYFGIAAHQLLERVGRGQISSSDQIEDSWESILAEIERDLIASKEGQFVVPLSKHIKQYEVKKRLVFRLAAASIRLTGNRNAISAFGSSSEMWLETEDQVISGIVDKVVRTPDGYEIIDYKTGEVTVPGQNEIKPEYQVQLKLYASALHSQTASWPNELKLQDVNGRTHNIPFTPQECTDLLAEARYHLKRINAIIDTNENPAQLMKQLATPSPEHCRFCRYRSVCTEYWKYRKQLVHLPWSHDVEGVVKGIDKLGNGTYLLKVTNSEIQYSIRGLPASLEISGRSVEGAFIRIFNLKLEDVAYHYSWIAATAIRGAIFQ